MQTIAKAEPAVFRGATPEIAAAIRDASAESGVSFSYLMAKAATESGFRADAKAPTSSATGLYQFIERTWMGMVRDHGDKFGLGRYADALESGKVDARTRKEILALRNDPKTAALMAAQYACDNREQLERTAGGPIGDTELYLAHFLGPGGAERFIKAWRADPDRSAASVCPEAARANRSIFYDKHGPRSLDEVHKHFAAKFDRCDTPQQPSLYAAQASSLYAAQPPAPSAAREPAPARAPGAVGGGWRPAAPAAVASAHPAPVLSPAAYAARLFMASLSVPGESGAASGHTR